MEDKIEECMYKLPSDPYYYDNIYAYDGKITRSKIQRLVFVGYPTASKIWQGLVDIGAIDKDTCEIIDREKIKTYFEEVLR